MCNCKAVGTPAEVQPKASDNDGTLISDPSWYRSMAGALQYLTLTRPDIAYAVQQVCLHMHAPRDVHLTLLKRILRYIKGTTSLGLRLHRNSTLGLTVYTDADWAGCPDAAIDVRVRGVPRRFARVLELQTTDNRVSVQCGG